MSEDAIGWIAKPVPGGKLLRDGLRQWNIAVSVGWRCNAFYRPIEDRIGVNASAAAPDNRN
jgi:hypothetical protein